MTTLTSFKIPMSSTLKRLMTLALTSLMLFGCVGEDLSEKEYIERAKTHQDKGDLKASVIELKNALRKNSNNPEARWLLGTIYVDAGEGAAAEKELSRAKELGIDAAAITVPLGRAWLLQRNYSRVINDIQVSSTMSDNDKAWVHALRGGGYLGQQQFDQAAAEYASALKIKQDFVPAVVGEARLALAMNKLDEARQLAEHAVANAPKSAEAWEFKGDIQQYEGDFKQAEAAYSKAIENSAHAPGPLRFKRALLRIAAGNKEGAEEDIAALKRLGADHPAAHYANGLLKIQNKQFAEAQDAFEKVLKVQPTDLQAKFFLGVAHYALRHMEQAAQTLGEVVSAVPQADQARVLLSAAYFKMGDYKKAERTLEPAVQRHPDYAAALNLMSIIYLKVGKTDEGIATLNKVVALKADAASHMRLGLSLAWQGDTQRAVDEMQAAIDLDTQLPGADPMLILTQVKAREYDKALEAAERYRAKQPQEALPLDLIGLVYMAKQDEAKAVAAFKQALTIAPGDPSAAINLAMLALKNGNRDEARNLYAQVLKRTPDHLPSLMRLAQLEAMEGRDKPFVEWLERAIKAHPQALEPRVALATYYVRVGQAPEALKLMTEIQELYPNDPATLAVIGEAQLANNQESNAIATFQKLVKLQPKSVHAHYLLAAAYSQANQASEFGKQLDLVLKLDANHFLARVAKARLLVLENKLRPAISILSDLQKTQGRHPDVLALEGLIAMRQQQPQKAAEKYRSALNASSRSKFAVDLAEAQWMAGDQQGVLSTLETWLAKHPDDAMARYNVAVYYQALNRPKEAKEAYVKVIGQVPDHVLALNNLAWLMRKEDPHQALKYAEQALQRAPKSPPIMDTLGTLLLEQGQAERAVRLLSDASANAPADLSIRYHLAQALDQAGDRSQARAVLEKVLAQRQTFSEQAEASALLEKLRN